MVMRPVRKSGGQTSLPKTEALNKCMAVATTPEAANDFDQQFRELVKQAGLEGNPLYQKAVNVVTEFANYVGLATSGGDPWSGKVPPTAFQNVQQKLAAASAAEINIEKPIRFDFAVSDASEFVKAYSVDGKPVDKATEHAMNKQLLGWLASDKNPASKNQADKLLMINHGGTLYVFDEKAKDQIKTIDGKPVLADPAAINKMMVDPKHGFAAFVQQTNQAAKLDIHSHDYSVHHTAEQEPASPAQGA